MIRRSLFNRPNRDAMALRSMIDRFFEEPLTTYAWSGLDETAMPNPVDVIEEKDAIVVRASLPGLRPNDVHVEVEEDEVHIWGERKTDETRDDDAFHLRELRYGRVDRRITLPRDVNADKAKAEFGDGVLSLHLPITETRHAREIKVLAKA